MCYRAVPHLGLFAVVQPEVVAGFEVESDGGVRDALQVHGQHVLGDVVVVQFVVAQSHVHVHSQEISGKNHNLDSFLGFNQTSKHWLRVKCIYRNRFGFLMFFANS